MRAACSGGIDAAAGCGWATTRGSGALVWLGAGVAASTRGLRVVCSTGSGATDVAGSTAGSFGRNSASAASHAVERCRCSSCDGRVSSDEWASKDTSHHLHILQAKCAAVSIVKKQSARELNISRKNLFPDHVEDAKRLRVLVEQGFSSGRHDDCSFAPRPQHVESRCGDAESIPLGGAVSP